MNRLLTPEGLRSRARGHTFLSRPALARRVVRLYPGQYVDPTTWANASSPQRFWIQLHSLAAHTDPVFCCGAALMIHGFATFGRPEDITTVSHGGRNGMQPSHYRPSETDDGPVPWFVRHHRHHHPDHSDAERVGPFRVVPLTEAAAETLRNSDLVQAITVADQLAQHGSKLQDSVRALIEPHAHRRNLALRRLDAGRPGAGSPAESASRALILGAGLPEPVLQQEFRDHAGLIGYGDAWWPELQLLGEIDGLAKYSEVEMTGGRTVEQVLRAEKSREARLLALGISIRRWGFAELLRPGWLPAMLMDAGLRPGRMPALR